MPVVIAAILPYLIVAVVATAISIGISYAVGALTPKPKFDKERGRTFMIRSSNEPHRWIYGEVVVSGPVLANFSWGDNNGSLGIVLGLAGHEVDSISDIWLNDELETLGKYNLGGTDWAQFNPHLGSSTQTADPSLMAVVPSLWTTNHRLQGITYLACFLYWNRSVWVTGAPNIKAKVKGRKVYDPRTATTAWSSNPALCQRDFLVNYMGISTSKIDDDTVIAAANICDEDVALAAGGTQKRYTCHGAFTRDRKPADIMEELLTASVGRCIYSQGKYKIYAGAFTSPTVTLGVDDLRGPIQVVSRPSRKDLFNAVRGIFIDASRGYLPTDFHPVTNSTYEAEDGGLRIYYDLELPYTLTQPMAQRIAKIYLERNRQALTVRFPAKLTALQLSTWDTVNVTIAALGWSTKTFRIVDMEFGEDFGIDLLLQEESAAAYTWSAEETTLDTAPNTTLPNPWTVLSPGAPQVTEGLYVTRDGSGVKTSVTMTWQASADQFVVSGGDYQAEYKRTSSPADSEFRIAGITPDTTFTIFDVAPGIYEFRVKARNQVGVSSAYATTYAKEIFGLSTPPDAPTGVTISTIGGLALIRWTQHSNLDVRVGGYIIFRHSQLMSGATWGDASSIGDAVPAVDTIALLPLKPGTYLLKARDSSGILSLDTATVTTEDARALAFTDLGQISEHTIFPGVHSNTTVVSGTLRLATSGGQVLPSGTYTHDAGFDFLTKSRVLISTVLEVLVVNELDMIDDRTDNIDDWATFDGTTGSEADCQVWARTTDDDPLGSPTWSDWQRLDSGEYYVRAMQFQTRLFSYDPAYNIHITELTLKSQTLISPWLIMPLHLTVGQTASNITLSVP